MSAQPAEMEQSIQLAIEAAAAANDAAEDVSKLSSETQAAAARLDSFGKGMKPVMLGVVAGAAISTVLGGLVYMRTLSEMRTANATQVEALKMFSTSVGELTHQIDTLKGMAVRMDALETAQSDGFAQVQTALESATAAMSETIAAQNESPGSAQMLRGLADSVQKDGQNTRDSFAAGLSDLQLALTRMLENRPLTSASAAAPAAAPRAAPVRPAPRKATAPRPAANPFQFP